MATATLPRIPVPAAARKGVGHPRHPAAPSMNLREPAFIVGQNSKRILGTIDENGARDPETVSGPALTVTNPGRQQAPPKNRTAKGAPAAAYGVNIQTGPGATEGTAAAGGTNGGSGSGAYGYREDPNYQNAEQNRINAEQGQTAASGAYLNQRQNALQQTQAENQGVTNAANNVQDQAATGAAKAIRGASDYQYGAFGLDTPQETFGATSGLPGVRQAISSQEDILKRQANQQQGARSDTLALQALAPERAGLATQTASTGVSQAQLNYFRNRPAGGGGGGGSSGSRAGPSANDIQAEERQAASNAGAARSRANSGGGINTTNVPVGRGTGVGDYSTVRGGSYGGAGPGSPGALATAQTAADNKIVTDPTTGKLTYARDLNSKYGGPAGLDIAQANQAVVEDPVTGRPTTRSELLSRMSPAQQAEARSSAGFVQDPTSGQQVTKGDLAKRTDRAGNIQDAQGTWHSKDGQNVLQNGKWTNTVTGATQVDDQHWRSADGLAQYTITDPKTGGGYWEGMPGTKYAGWTIGAKGVWTSPDGQYEMNTSTGAVTRAATTLEKQITPPGQPAPVRIPVNVPGSGPAKPAQATEPVAAGGGFDWAK